MPRHPTQGFTLLPTLAAILLLAGLTLLLQSRSQANLALLARLTADLQAQPARDALYDRLRPIVADAMAGTRGPGIPTLDGAPLTLTQGGQAWEVRVQDVEGLVDLSLAAPDLPPGLRYPGLPMTLARFGIDPAAVDGMVTRVRPHRGPAPGDDRPQAASVRDGPRSWLKT
jgi:hypothetical protein